jgi:transposase
MEYARKLPAAPPGSVTAGIDWASADHAVCVVDASGKAVARFTVEHSAAGLAELARRLRKSGAAEAAIERGDGPVVGALLEAGVTVVVITPNQVKNLRSRYGSAGNKDDRFDAFVLADTLRTGRARLQPLEPDSPATAALRSAVRARRDLVAHRVALCNQLCAHLQGCFPGAVGLFSDLDSPVSLAFLARFDCQERAGWLSPRRLAAWLKSQGYCGRKDPAELHARLTTAPRGATGDDGAALARVTRALLHVLNSLVTQIKALEAQIAEQLALHADAHVFTSLPRSGTVRAARLLAEIGDCRGPLPHPRVADLRRRRRPLHPPVRQGQDRRLPLDRRQAAPRRRLRLRRRHPPRQPLGRPPLQRRHRPRQGPPPRRPHPRPRLALRHLALLARRHRLRPRPPQSPPTNPRRGKTGGGLTQGYSRAVRPSRTARRAVPAPSRPRAVTAVPERGRPCER